jgi:purine-cytosine permease-like protein
MVDDDNPAGGDLESGAFDGDSGEPIGPRRSTWTPPPARGTESFSPTSDDDLASALAEDLDRVTHHPVTHEDAEVLESGLDAEDVVAPDHAAPDHAAPDEAAPDEEAPNEEAPDEEAEEARDSSFPEPPAAATPVADSPVADLPVAAPPAADLRVTELPIPDPPDAEHPDVSDAASSLTPPVRRSLPMSELAATLAQQAQQPGATGDVMAQLEEQLRLREQDTAEFTKWQASMLERGAPEAIDEVETARSTFGDLFDTPAPAAMSSAPESDHSREPDAPPAPEPAPESAPESAQESAHEPGREVTHTFRMDEALDSELKSAPAPMSAPLRDIPPPPGHELMPPRRDFIPPPPDAQPTPTVVGAESIPDLVEPRPAPPAGVFDFDALLSGAVPDPDVEPTVFAAEPHSAEELPEESASYSVRDDDVADTDQAYADLMGPFPVTAEGVASLPDAPVAPVEPLTSRQVPTVVSEAEPETPEAKPKAPAVFRVEESSVEPTPADQRVGRAARLFWLWFAANSSVVSVAFGGAVFALGMSLRQAIIATVIGVVISFVPLGLGTLAGKWSGQPTMVVSRATFGHLGNLLPAALALIVRIFWGAVLLWFLAAGTSRILVGAKLAGPLGESEVTFIVLAVGVLIALAIAYFGYGLIARIQLIFTIVSAVLIVGLIVITWPAVNITVALTVGDGPWILLVTGAVLVFSFVGLVWAVSSADLARYQRPGSSDTATILWPTFGAAIPAFALISYGAVLAASNPDVAAGLVDAPLDTIAMLIPVWYPVPLIAALALSLLSGVVMSIYSAGFALQSAGAALRRPVAVVVAGIIVAAVAVAIAVSVGDFTLILRDLATSLAVPVAAWAGIFGAEMMIRKRGFDSSSLLKRGGVYSDVQWVNLAMLVVGTVVGFGLTTATVGWLSWQGFLFPLLNIPLTSDLAGSDLGVFVALGVGLMTPIVAGIPGIRRQEQPIAVRTPNLATPQQ